MPSHPLARPLVATLVLLSSSVAMGQSASVSPASLTFANQAVGTRSAASTVTVKNTGTAPLRITAVTVTGTHAADFSSTNTCSAAVSPNATCSISVTFQPSAIGLRGAWILIASNTADRIVTLSGSGAAPPQPAITLTPTSISFANQAVGYRSTGNTVSAKNTGTAPLQISTITITGANAADFASTNTCGAPVAPNAICSISVTFQPTTRGARSASLSIKSNAADRLVTLSGTGTLPAPAITLTPSSLTFATQVIGTGSAISTVTVRNAGTAPLQISTITITGANAADFASTNTCGSAVAPNASCLISATFRPTARGTRSATLSIKSNTADRSVSLSGAGVPPPTPVISLAPSSLTFANQSVGTRSATNTVTVKNTGTAPLQISTITLTGANAADFASTNTCGAPIAFNATCSIAVTFRPSVAGSRSAMISIRNNATDRSVSISGTGTADSLPIGVGAQEILSTTYFPETVVRINSVKNATSSVSGSMPDGNSKIRVLLPAGTYAINPIVDRYHAWTDGGCNCRWIFSYQFITSESNSAQSVGSTTAQYASATEAFYKSAVPRKFTLSADGWVEFFILDPFWTDNSPNRGVSLRLEKVSASLKLQNASTQRQWSENGHIYEFLNTDIRWSDALFASQKRTVGDNVGYLTTLVTEAENKFVAQFIPSLISKGWDRQEVWIAATDQKKEGEFIWAAGPEEGAGVSFARWAEGYGPSPNPLRRSWFESQHLGADYAALSTYRVGVDNFFWYALDQEWFKGGLRQRDNSSNYSREFVGNAYVVEYGGTDFVSFMAQFSDVTDTAFSTDATLYIADYLNHRIYKRSKNGAPTPAVGTGAIGSTGDEGAAISATLNHPIAVATDESGNLYIAEEQGGRIRKVFSNETITTLASGLISPSALAVDSSNRVLYVSEADAGRIKKISLENGAVLDTYAGLNHPRGLAIDLRGNLYVAEYGSGRILKYSSSGNSVLVLAGVGTNNIDTGDEGPAKTAALREPLDVAVDELGTLFIGGSAGVRIVDTAGVIRTAVSGVRVNGLTLMSRDLVFSTGVDVRKISYAYAGNP